MACRQASLHRASISTSQLDACLKRDILYSHGGDCGLSLVLCRARVQLADVLVENESEDLFSFSGREVSHLKPLSVVKSSLHLHANTFSC